LRQRAALVARVEQESGSPGLPDDPTPVLTPPPRRRRWLPVAFVAAAVLAAAATLALRWRPDERALALPAPVPAATVKSDLPRAAEVPVGRVGAQAAPPPEPRRGRAWEPSEGSHEDEPAAVAPASEAGRSRPRAEAAPARRPARRTPARSHHCTPPFTIGPDGLKQYKVECL
jgi:hypothetical protein